MSLKQSVVIVNEFTCRTSKGGTRGGTPGDYVLRYMARKGATEDLTPVRRTDTENFIMRYMARDSATDEAQSVFELKKDMHAIQGDGGIAFGYGDVSLSHEKLKAAAKDIQKNFDAGKTVLKTVISFDESYLRQHNIISPDFEFHNEGDFRGNIDQMKLRMSIMKGVDKMSRNYDDLQYIGVIQVDTKHVHCHLAMVDRGTGILMPDGTQRGKITEHEKRDLRRGIDSFLDEKQHVKMMAANVDFDKRNTICFIKKYTHKVMENRGFTQFLISCLPDDRSMWRAGSNAKDMRKANSIVREYVSQLLEQPDSGYKEALERVDRYARSRSRNEGLSAKHYRELFRNGQQTIISEGMNAVYSVLKQIPVDDLRVTTPMLDSMSLPYEDMASVADSDPMIEFGFKLRSYKTRLDYHKAEFMKYHDATVEYSERQSEGRTDTTSVPLYDFFREEEEYNEKLMAKYQYFLSFIPPEKEYMDGFDELMEYGRRLANANAMISDRDIRRLSPDAAEDYGRRVYDETGGSLIISDPDVFSDRVKDMAEHYESMKDAYRTKLSGYGFQLNDNDEIEKRPAYPFDEVKSLDVHHMTYDFPYDFAISRDNAMKFVTAADKRYDAFIKARAYLEGSGQADMLQSFPVADIELQHGFADRFRSKDSEYHNSRIPLSEKKRPSRTVRLDYDFYVHQDEEIKSVVKNTINSLQYE